MLNQRGQERPNTELERLFTGIHGITEYQAKQYNQAGQHMSPLNQNARHPAETQTKQKERG